MRPCKRMLSLFLLPLCLLLAVLPASAQPARFLEGVHFQELDVPVEAGNEVLEFFWYGCPSCYAMETPLHDWLARRPGLDFGRSPAVWSAATTVHARLFHTASALRRLDELHPLLFEAVQTEQGQLLSGEAAQAFFLEQGVDAETFEKTASSFAVATALRRSEALIREVRPPSVPALLVRGRHLVSGSEALRSHEEMLEVVDYLLSLDR